MALRACLRPRERPGIGAEPLISHPSTRLLKRRNQRSWTSGRTGAASKPISPSTARCHRDQLALRARNPMTSRSRRSAPQTGRIYGCNQFRPRPASCYYLLYRGRCPYRVIRQRQARMCGPSLRGHGRCALGCLGLPAAALNDAGGLRLPRIRSRDYLRCLLTSLVISNIETCALPPNTGLSLSSALIMRRFFLSCSPLRLM